MKDRASLAIPAHTLCRLLQYVDAHPTEQSAGELAALAIDEWLVRASGDNVPRTRHRGYQWKTVFLPEGTQLRTWHRSGCAYAEVIGDSVVYQGHPVSPHEFICHCKGVSRSAWAEVALLLPGENHWKRADAYRRELDQHLQPQIAPTPPLLPPSLPQPSPAPTAGLPPGAMPVAPASGWRRLPRVLPISTQARLQHNVHIAANADLAKSSTPDRRRDNRRQKNDLLD